MNMHLHGMSVRSIRERLSPACERFKLRIRPDFAVSRNLLFSLDSGERDASTCPPINRRNLCDAFINF